MSDAAPVEVAGDAQSASLKRMASRSVMWTAIGKASNTIISLLVMALLTRLLTPADFGIVAMVAVISGFLSIMAEAGVSTAVVQKRDLDDRALSTLFWMGLGISILASAGLAIASPLVARFFAEPRLTPVVALLSCSFVFLAMGRIPNGLLERGFRFKELAASEVTAAVVSGAVGVALALSGAGYYALVFQTLVSGLLNAVVRLIFSRFCPRLVFDTAALRAVTGYSTGVTAFSAINYWARNLDKALIGRALGAAQLGFYGRAYALMLYPLEGINGIINPSLHPLFSAMQGDPERMTRAYLKIVRLVATLALPAMCIFGALAPEIVHTVWGRQWDPSVKVFAILCFVGSIQPVGSTFGAVFLATNRTRLLAVVGLVNSLVMMAGIALGVQFGIRGVAIGYSLAYGAIFLPTMYIVVAVLLRGRVADIVRIFASASAIGAPVLLGLLAFNRLLRGKMPEALHLCGGVLLGIALWLAAFALVDRDLLAEARSFLPGGKSQKPSTPH
jgi:O-antigen/teichoic acid export membrane protein